VIKPTEKDIGRMVVYRQPYMKTTENWEFGIITSFNEHFVHVRYGTETGSKSTKHSDLTWLDEIKMLDIGQNRYIFPTNVTKEHIEGFVFDAYNKHISIKKRKILRNRVFNEVSNEELATIKETFGIGYNFIQAALTMFILG